jgi:hypothetical protein
VVCAAALQAEASATQAMMNGTILFRPMAVIDPLVVVRLMIICGGFALLRSGGGTPVTPTELIVLRGV